MPKTTSSRAQPSPAPGAWLALTAVALALPVAWLLTEPLLAPDRLLLVPSASLVWAALLAALIGGLVIGWLARPGRRGARLGMITAAGLGALVAGGLIAYGAVSGASTAVGSCAEPLVAGGAASIDGRATVDGAVIDERSGTPTDATRFVSAIESLRGVPSEDRGVERVEGVEARRCSMLIDGNTALEAVPALAKLGRRGDQPLTELPTWRGELEWWRSADGQLVRGRVSVGGHPADAWQSRGLRGAINAELRMVRGGRP